MAQEPMEKMLCSKTRAKSKVPRQESAGPNESSEQWSAETTQINQSVLNSFCCNNKPASSASVCF